MQRQPIKRKMPTDVQKRAYHRRRVFREAVGSCMVCGARNPINGLQVHEIARGAFRQVALTSRSCWLVLCQEHHDAMSDYSQWPIVRQLALKLLKDKEGYNLDEVCFIRVRAKGAITQEEVSAEVLKLINEGHNPGLPIYFMEEE